MGGKLRLALDRHPNVLVLVDEGHASRSQCAYHRLGGTASTGIFAFFEPSQGFPCHTGQEGQLVLGHIQESTSGPDLGCGRRFYC